jgi:PAS domain S-box-containing protein
MNPPLKILHLEDNAADAELVKSMLAAEHVACNIVHVTNGEDFRAALQDGNFDVILSDYSLPAFDGLTAMKLAREKCPEIPYVFVSGTMGEEAAVESLKSGAADYVLKDRLARLAAAIRRVVRESEERCHHTQALERIREQAALLDEAQDAILVCDTEGNVRYWNRSAERIYGQKATDAIGKPVSRLLGHNPSRLQTVFRQTLRSGQWTGELRLSSDSGTESVVQSRWTLLRTPTGEPKSVMAISTDVTERKALEAQFLRAQRMQTVGVLMGGLAHDLGNMLVPILVGVQLLREGATKTDQDTILETMQTSAKRSTEMVRQILSFSRGVAGEPTVLEIEPLIAEMQQLVTETFPRTIVLETQISSPVGRVLGNSTQLHQVLLNLCVNARDAMPAGGKLQLSARNVTLNHKTTDWYPKPVSGEYVELAVTDNGSGMSALVLRNLFEPFFTTKDSDRGTGLGLSTVQAIVKNHNGFVEVKSAPGQGSSFSVFLPRTEEL